MTITARGEDQFQSRSGFSPYCDAAFLAAVVTMVAVFQSRSGFSPYRDELEQHPGRRDDGVSIPFWVFSLPRRCSANFMQPHCGVSIPFWVFSLPRPRRA